MFGATQTTHMEVLIMFTNSQVFDSIWPAGAYLAVFMLEKPMKDQASILALGIYSSYYTISCCAGLGNLLKKKLIKTNIMNP